MFAYCGNNPVRRCDAAGLWWGEDVWDWICGTAEDAYDLVCGAAEDVGDFCADIVGGIVSAGKAAYDYITNENETVVLEASLFAFYKGRLCVKLPIGTDAFSFGIIFLGNEVHTRSDAIATVQHEYGHTVQFAEYGILGYTAFVAIPSIIGYNQDKNGTLGCYYYDQPWERQADLYGGVTRSRHSTTSAAYAEAYTQRTVAICRLLEIILPY